VRVEELVTITKQSAGVAGASASASDEDGGGAR
jgi:hypothetical protein